MDFSDRSRTLLEKSSSLPRMVVVAVGVGVAFGAGVVVGAPVAGDRGVVVVDDDPIKAAAQRTKLYEERMKSAQLSWHKEITAFDPALPPPPAVATSTKVPPKPAPLPEEPSSAPIVDKAVVAAPPEPAPAPAPAKTASADDDGDDGEAEPPTKVDPKRLDEAIHRVVGGEQKKAQDEVPLEKRYALQLASTGTEAAAQVLAKGWAERGQKVVVVAADVPGKGTMYRVRVAGIASRAAADALKAKLGQGLVVAD